MIAIRVALCVGMLAVLGHAAAEEAPAAVEKVGEAEYVCQLTGETDWRTGQPTAARTLSNFGLDGTDLGYPVERGDDLILLFGDSWPPRHPAKAIEDAVPGDAVGVVTRRAPPGDDGKCLDMHILADAGPPKTFASATVVGETPVHQGFFNVPTGGIDIGGRLHAFFWTDHCPLPSDLEPSPEAPLARPPRAPRCPESDDRNSIGRGAVASSEDGARTFGHAAWTPPGFVYASAVASAETSDVYIFAVPRYRASVPYLARATADTLPLPTSWRFFVGLDDRGQPKWASHGEWSGAASQDGWRPPGAPELFSDDAGSQACIGEFSITFNHPLRAWLLLYNCRGEIEARVATKPWGPWSAPTHLLGPTDDIRCRLVMAPGGCGDRRDFWPDRRRNGRVEPGGLYAPFVLDRYTIPADAGDRSAIIYWLVSTWNPYEVSVMRTTLRWRD